VPPENRGRRLTQPAPTTPTAATTPKIAVIVPGQADGVAAEAAEQLQYELHQVGQCPLACPWCPDGRWSA
jgi:hypothetical protein